jgi:hypothetical protein
MFVRGSELIALSLYAAPQIALSMSSSPVITLLCRTMDSVALGDAVVDTGADTVPSLYLPM